MKLFILKKLLGHLRLLLIIAIFIPEMNFLKNSGLLKEELNKIGFMHYYENIYIKKLARSFMVIVY